MTKEITLKGELTDFLLYTSPSVDIRVEAFLHDKNIWLTQKRMAELFNVTPQNITIHFKNVFETVELKEISTCKKFLQIQNEGGRDVERNFKYYNLDAILSIGYRINSSQATNFRIWATKILKEYIIKGFAMDYERLKNGQYFGKDYFQELLERVCSIWVSERQIWQKITDIFAECSLDSNDKSIGKSEFKKTFYASILSTNH